VLLAATLSLAFFGCTGKTAAHFASPVTPAPTPPPTCPLTGALAPGRSIPNRPPLAVKVENLPESRPPTGLNSADVVYEEPVEEGITRFIVLYQCRDAPVVEPVRSARLVDPDVLAQYGRPLFAYAGGIGSTLDKVRSSNLVDLSFIYDMRGYRRDPARSAPHNLIGSTPQLYARAGVRGDPTHPVFTYSNTPAPGVPGAVVHVPFSSYSDVTWRWNALAHAYERSYGTAPATLSDGAHISTANVVVQFVSVTPSPFVEDPTGAHQNYVQVVGAGRAMVCRAGTCVGGTWRRTTMSDVTRYLDVAGREISLIPGRTWVELAPSGTLVSHGL
jgi:hypothetical protein